MGGAEHMYTRGWNVSAPKLSPGMNRVSALFSGMNRGDPTSPPIKLMTLMEKAQSHCEDTRHGESQIGNPERKIRNRNDSWKMKLF